MIKEILLDEMDLIRKLNIELKIHLDLVPIMIDIIHNHI